jgi:hypothetical protein
MISKAGISAGRVSMTALLLAGLLCVTVGTSDASAIQVMRWNAVKIQVPGGLAGADSFGELFGNMACVSASDCWSAGTGVNKSGRDVPFIEHWNGHQFRLVKTPVRKAFLQGLACVTARNCWLAGGAGSNSLAYGKLGHFSPLMEHWNGKKWARVKVPNSSGTDDELADVSCISRSSCYAVGWTRTSRSAKTLIEHWGGKKWTIVSHAAGKGQSFASLDGVDCVPHSMCNVVGQEQATTSTPPHVFGERGVGKKWSVVAMPSPASPNTNTEVYGMSCPAANDCLATGSAYFWPGGGLDPGEAIAEHWNGSHWSLIAPNLAGPPSGGDVNRLSDIACSSTTQCWAVGSTFTDMAIAPAETASWDGSKFAPGDNDNPYPQDQLGAVGCAGASECLSVGYGESNGGHLNPIAERLTVFNCPRCRTALRAMRTVMATR